MLAAFPLEAPGQIVVIQESVILCCEVPIPWGLSASVLSAHRAFLWSSQVSPYIPAPAVWCQILSFCCLSHPDLSSHLFL